MRQVSTVAGGLRGEPRLRVSEYDPGERQATQSEKGSTEPNQNLEPTSIIRAFAVSG